MCVEKEETFIEETIEPSYVAQLFKIIIFILIYLIVYDSYSLWKNMAFFVMKINIILIN